MSERERIQEVNVELGDEISRMLYEASKYTHDNQPGLLTEFHESFSGARAISLANLSDAENLFMNLGFDGVGTKVEISERLDDHSVVAFDLFAMVCDDAVVRGAEPVAIGSILDVRHLGNPNDPASIEYAQGALRQLADGYIRAAQAAGVVVVNGEVAELGDRVGGYDGHTYNLNYNWGASVLWLAHRDRLLTGHQIQPGDALVGLPEHGFRSNGITDVRKVMLERYGEDWHNKIIADLGEVSLGQLVQRPSTIYAKFISELTGGYNISIPGAVEVHGIAHITGGGQPSKLERMLEPSGLGVVIDEPIEPPEIMLHVQQLTGFEDRKAYSKWHMGPGMVIVTPEPDRLLTYAEWSGVEAQAIGEVRETPGILIKNRGVIQDEKWLTF